MSPVPPRDPAQSDLTAQAKIRNAAIAHFARDGFQKTNLRDIAAAAGVSVGLIAHHFGNKDGLRTACDEHVLRVLTSRAGATESAEGLRDLLGVYLADPDEYSLHMQYLARAVHEDAPAASTFVTTLVDGAEEILRTGAANGTMRPSSDPRALAVLSVLVSMAMLTMPPPLARALGHDRFGPEVLHRMSLPTLEVYTRGLFTTDTLAQAAEDAWDAARPPQQKKD